MNRTRRIATAFAAALLLSGLAAALEEEEKGPLADPTEEATRLKNEATEFFNASGDTDLSPKERKKNRQGAFQRLIKARLLLDTWLEEHPGAAERLDDLYCDIAAMMYWIRKEATLGELPPYPPPTEEPEKPPEAEDPAAPAPAPVEPAAPKGPTAADALEEIRSYERRFPGDVPGLHDRYKKFLADFPDTSTPEYEAAAGRLEALDRRLKDVYRLARDDDPDSLKDVDDADAIRLIRQLAADLREGSEPVRARAARYLGGLGSGEAAVPLVELLKTEPPGPVFDATVEALSNIGGRRVCSRLVKIKPGSDLGLVVVEILCRTVERGGVSARIAGEAMAGYVEELPVAVQHRATETLFKGGRPGALGLALALHLAPVEKKVDYIEHLAEMKEPRTAGILATWLQVNPVGTARRRQHAAARKAILAIGKPGVRYLIPVLDDDRYQLWTAEMLRQITGERPKNDERRTWEKWYRKNRRQLEGR